jgi:hypothetical protein
MTDFQSTLDAAHCHGIDCCWDCFHGHPVHPRDVDDYDCTRELRDFGAAAVKQGCRLGGHHGS